MEYTGQIQYIHSQLAPDMAIDAFVEALNPTAIGLANETQFYAPFRFSVQICGGINAAAGAIRVDVPVHANPNWLNTMKRRFAGMIGLPATPLEKMDFRTVANVSISSFPIEELSSIGKLNLFIGEKMVRMESMPPIPVEYSLNKLKNIETWYDSMIAGLPDQIAKHLLGKSEVQINSAIKLDGPVQQLIAAHIKEYDGGVGWNEFVRVHHMNSPMSMSDEESSKTLQLVSKHILTGLRDFIKASAVPIGNYIATMETKKMERELESQGVGDDAVHYAPILGTGGGEKAKIGKNTGYKLFHKLAADLLSTPGVQRDIVEAVYNRPLSISECEWYSYDDVEPPRGGQHRSRPAGGAPRAEPPDAGGFGGGGGGNEAPPPPVPRRDEEILRPYVLDASGDNMRRSLPIISNMVEPARSTLFAVIAGVEAERVDVASSEPDRLTTAQQNLDLLNRLLYNAGQIPHVVRINGLNTEDVTIEVLVPLGLKYGIEIPSTASVEDAIKMIAVRLAIIQESQAMRELYFTPASVTTSHTQNDTTAMDVAKELAGAAGNALVSVMKGGAGLLAKGATSLLTFGASEQQTIEKPTGAPLYRGTILPDDVAIQRLRQMKPEIDQLGGVRTGLPLVSKTHAQVFQELNESISRATLMPELEAAYNDGYRQSIGTFLKNCAQPEEKYAKPFLVFLGYMQGIDVSQKSVDDAYDDISARLRDLHGQEVRNNLYAKAFNVAEMQAAAVDTAALAVDQAEEARRLRDEAERKRLEAEAERERAREAEAARQAAETKTRAEAAERERREAEAAAKVLEKQAAVLESESESKEAEAEQSVRKAMVEEPVVPPVNAKDVVVVTAVPPPTAPPPPPTAQATFKSLEEYIAEIDAEGDGLTQKRLREILPTGGAPSTIDMLFKISTHYRLGIQKNKSMREAIIKKLPKQKAGGGGAAPAVVDEPKSSETNVLGKYLRRVSGEEAIAELNAVYSGKYNDGSPLLRNPTPAEIKKGAVSDYAAIKKVAGVPSGADRKSAIWNLGLTKAGNVGKNMDNYSVNTYRVIAAMFDLKVDLSIVNPYVYEGDKDEEDKRLEEVQKDILTALGNYALSNAVKHNPVQMDLQARIGQHHPWNAQIHHTLQPLAGTYPTYYNLLHTKQDMSKDANFTGDVAETYKAYHLLSGIPQSPAGTLISCESCRSEDDEGERIEHHVSDEEEEPVYGKIQSQAPPVKPISSSATKQVIPPRPPIKRFVPPKVQEKMLSKLELYIGDAADEEDYPIGDEEYNAFDELPMSSDAFN